MGPRVTALSIHADYRCRHSGHCCSTDWDVAVEVPVYRRLDEALRAGTLRVSPEAAGLEPFILGPDLPADTTAIFQRTDDGRCVFFERGPNLCIVHRDLGETALAATCKHFPRLSIDDARGTSVALSHFCPTAAGMLFRDDVPVEIVEAPPAFPAGDYDGLRVGADDLPPLLTPTMLMDAEGYEAWERHMVARCAQTHLAPESVLATLARDAGLLRRWTPGGIALSSAVGHLPADVVPGESPEVLDASLALHAEVLGAVPEEWRPMADTDGLREAYDRFVRPRWSDFSPPLNRYLAAKAFATWTAYQGQGVATIVRGIEAALALVRVEASRKCRDQGQGLDAALLLEAFREADFVLNHLAVGEDLALGWSVVERHQP